MPEVGRDKAPRVLVIENDAMIRNLLREALEDDGYRVMATDRHVDPEDLRQLRPSVLLMDLYSDGIPSGWDYIRRLRAQPGMTRLPVIVCTADHEQLRDAGAYELSLATAVLLKPFDLDDLTQTVASTIQVPTRATPIWTDASMNVDSPGDD